MLNFLKAKLLFPTHHDVRLGFLLENLVHVLQVLIEKTWRAEFREYIVRRLESEHVLGSYVVWSGVKVAFFVLKNSISDFYIFFFLDQIAL